jgi:hypothetical protein
MSLPRSWQPVAADTAVQFEAELRREVCTAHRLHGLRLQAVARRENRDDVLFTSDGKLGPVFVVHLTWSIESDPKWPSVIEYADMADFLGRWEREELTDEIA